MNMSQWDMASLSSSYVIIVIGAKWASNIWQIQQPFRYLSYCKIYLHAAYKETISLVEVKSTFVLNRPGPTRNILRKYRTCKLQISNRYKQELCDCGKYLRTKSWTLQCRNKAVIFQIKTFLIFHVIN